MNEPKKKLTHSDQLVLFINRAQTYPTIEASRLAIWLADKYYIRSHTVRFTYKEITETFNITKRTAIRWVNTLISSGHWIKKESEGSTLIYSLSPNAKRDVTNWLNKTNEERNQNHPPIITPT